MDCLQEQQFPKVDPIHVCPLSSPQAPSSDILSVASGIGANDVEFTGVCEEEGELVHDTRDAEGEEHDSESLVTLLEVLVIVMVVVRFDPELGVTVDVDVYCVML